MKEKHVKACDVCGKVQESTTPTYVITEQNRRKNINICNPCVSIVYEVPIGQSFPLQSTDEMVRLPQSFFTKS